MKTIIKKKNEMKMKKIEKWEKQLIEIIKRYLTTTWNKI